MDTQVFESFLQWARKDRFTKASNFIMVTPMMLREMLKNELGQTIAVGISRVSGCEFVE
jgi:hypothetical protein